MRKIIIALLTLLVVSLLSVATMFAFVVFISTEGWISAIAMIGCFAFFMAAIAVANSPHNWWRIFTRRQPRETAPHISNNGNLDMVA